MTQGARLTRRRFLASVTTLGGSALVVKTQPWRGLVAFVPVSVAERLAGLITHQDSAGVVGRAYLDRVPGESSVSRLVDSVAVDLPGGRRTLRDASDADLRELLAVRIRSDFEEDRVVDVDGWILSPTEARLYALTTLV